MIKSLAAEWGRHGMRFVGIAPGPIPTKGAAAMSTRRHVAASTPTPPQARAVVGISSPSITTITKKLRIAGRLTQEVGARRLDPVKTLGRSADMALTRAPPREPNKNAMKPQIFTSSQS